MTNAHTLPCATTERTQAIVDTLKPVTAQIYTSWDRENGYLSLVALNDIDNADQAHEMLYRAGYNIAETGPGRFLI